MAKSQRGSKVSLVPLLYRISKLPFGEEDVGREAFTKHAYSKIYHKIRISSRQLPFSSSLLLLPHSIYIIVPDIGLAVRVFANGPGDLSSIPGRVIPKTQKMVFDASLLNTQHYKVRIKGKVEQSRERVAPSPTPWCSSYRKGSLRVTLDYGRQLYFYFIYIILLSIIILYY